MPLASFHLPFISWPACHLPAITTRRRHSLISSHHAIMSLPSSASWIHEFALSNGYVHAIGQPIDDQPSSDWYITSFPSANRPPIYIGKKLVIESSVDSRIIYASVKSVERLERRHISLVVEPVSAAYGVFRPPPCIVNIPLSLIRLSPLRRLQHFFRLSRLQDDIQAPHEPRHTASLSPASTPSQRPAESPSLIDFLDLSSSTHSL
jgi:hypothetical protein